MGDCLQPIGGVVGVGFPGVILSQVAVIVPRLANAIHCGEAIGGVILVGCGDRRAGRRAKTHDLREAVANRVIGVVEVSAVAVVGFLYGRGVASVIGSDAPVSGDIQLLYCPSCCHHSFAALTIRGTPFSSIE